MQGFFGGKLEEEQKKIHIARVMRVTQAGIIHLPPCSHPSARDQLVVRGIQLNVDCGETLNVRFDMA
jgi:hypothetical protein